MILLGTFMIMVVNTYEAVINVNPIYVRAAESLGADKFSIYRTVVVPAIMPSLAAGLRISSALSFTLVVASEFMGAQSGLGYMIMSARRTLTTETIFLGCLIFGIVSTIIDFGIRKGDQLPHPLERAGALTIARPMPARRCRAWRVRPLWRADVG